MTLPSIAVRVQTTWRHSHSEGSNVIKQYYLFAIIQLSKSYSTFHEQYSLSADQALRPERERDAHLLCNYTDFPFCVTGRMPHPSDREGVCEYLTRREPMGPQSVE